MFKFIIFFFYIFLLENGLLMIWPQHQSFYSPPPVYELGLCFFFPEFFIAQANHNTFNLLSKILQKLRNIDETFYHSFIFVSYILFIGMYHRHFRVTLKFAKQIYSIFVLVRMIISHIFFYIIHYVIAAKEYEYYIQGRVKRLNAKRCNLGRS